MGYKVINRFIDKEDNNTSYKVGEGFPKGDSKPSKKRIEELSKPHPKYKLIFIEEIKKEVKSGSVKSKKELNKR